MSLRDYSGHKRGCGATETFLVQGQIVKGVCTCNLDKALAEHDARERKIAAVISAARLILTAECDACGAVITIAENTELGKAIEALQMPASIERGEDGR